MRFAVQFDVPNIFKVSDDPIRSFVPVGLLGVGPMLPVAGPDVPVRSVPELITYAKANPGKLTIASAEVGSPHHLIVEFFCDRAWISLTHVPCKGAVQYIADLLGGQVRLAVSTISPALPPAVLERLRSAYRTTIEDPEVSNALRKAGIEEVGAWSPARIGEQMQADYVKWGEIIRKANIRMDG